MFPVLMRHLRVGRRGRGRPRTRPDRVRGDKAYSSRANRAHLCRRGIVAVIPEPADQIGHRRRREVKGFPSRDYADTSGAGEAKRTLPSTQAGHWYDQAVRAALRLRGKEPRWRSVIVLPDFPRYRELHVQTVGSHRFNCPLG